MSNLYDFLLLLAVVALIGGWLKLSRGREQAVAEARRQCERHGLQLLDESVGLRALRWRRLEGRRQLERRYDFEVSIDGDDREPGWLWISGNRLTELGLPTIEWRIPAASPAPATTTSSTASNVVPLRPRLRDDQNTRH